MEPECTKKEDTILGLARLARQGDYALLSTLYEHFGSSAPERIDSAEPRFQTLDQIIHDLRGCLNTQSATMAFLHMEVFPKIH